MGLYLPSGVALTDEQQNKVIEAVSRFWHDEVFGLDYSDSYDDLYADKDYGAECDLLEKIFRRADRPVHTILDLGCGTGRHSVELARRGYELVGSIFRKECSSAHAGRALAEG